MHLFSIVAMKVFNSFQDLQAAQNAEQPISNRISEELDMLRYLDDKVSKMEAEKESFRRHVSDLMHGMKEFFVLSDGDPEVISQAKELQRRIFELH